jgi:hypothetical protein
MKPRMNDDQVRQMYLRYCDGDSIRIIANAIWQEFGFSHSYACEKALGRYFKRLGLKRRNRSEAQTIRQLRDRPVPKRETEKSTENYLGRYAIYAGGMIRAGVRK